MAVETRVSNREVAVRIFSCETRLKPLLGKRGESFGDC